MPEIIISCLSQKGGVGKSTMSRLIARTYASAGWAVKIADFNVRQLTAVDWVAARMGDSVEPSVAAEPYNSVKKIKTETAFDLVVCDGKPDSDQTSLEIARVSNLIVIPTGFAVDDLKPQLAFASELVKKGVDRSRILFVLNNITDSEAMLQDAKQVILQAGFQVSNNGLMTKTGYTVAQNTGRAVSETKFASLNERAEDLAAEIVAYLNTLEQAA